MNLLVNGKTSGLHPKSLAIFMQQELLILKYHYDDMKGYLLDTDISERLHHVANLDIDCFRTPDGKLVVLEMNCRFGGQYPFTHNAGVDLPRQIIKWLEGENTDMTLLKQKNGVVSCKDLNPVVFVPVQFPLKDKTAPSVSILFVKSNNLAA